MGIFGFKKKFDIVPKKEKMLNIVNTYAVNKTVKINARVVVPENFVFVLGKKGKVTDKFDSGEHFFNFSNLPHTCRRFGIDKIKKGKQKDKFDADLYFVNKGLFPGKFQTYRKVEMGTKAYGFYSMHVVGVYSYRVVDVKEFMQSLLNVYDFIKTGEAEEIVENWVSEVVVDQLEKQNFMIADVLAKKPRIEEFLKQKVSKLFAIAGLELVEFKIERYKLPKRYEQNSNDLENSNDNKEPITQETEAENLLLCKEQDCDFTQNKNGECIKEANKSSTENNILNDDMNDAKQMLKEFGIIKDNEEDVVEDVNFNSEDEQDCDDCEKIEDGVKTQNANKEDVEYVPFGNFKIKEQSNTKVTSSSKTFVDLNLDTIYNEKKSTKRCLNCGAENDTNATNCILCGDRLNNE